MTDSAPFTPPSEEQIDALAEFIERRQRLLVLTGAGCSTRSGIPDYRDHDGQWKRGAPILYKEFVDDELKRKRYWARSAIGWPRVAKARPNVAHFALADLERSQRVWRLVTQNVDGLHQRGGSNNVIDLHGRLHDVACMDCKRVAKRDSFQLELEAANRDLCFSDISSASAPDGDVDLGDADYDSFVVPSCKSCGGVVKPQVVFFGEAIPPLISERANVALQQADGLLVVGSSLMVFSGFRFARSMAERKRGVAAVNLGHTRADDMLDLKINAEAGGVLKRLAKRFGGDVSNYG